MTFLPRWLTRMAGVCLLSLAATGCGITEKLKAPSAPQGTITQPAADVSIQAGQAVAFAGTAVDPDGDPVTVVWSFGDGSSTTLMVPGNHAYAAAGTYTVTLTATDSNGVADPHPPTRTITVQAPANLPPVGTITLPAADVTISAGQSVTFGATATDADGDAVTVVWDFGDGTTSTLLAPGAHAYPTAGTYHVTLTATDSANLADPNPPSRTVTVQAAPVNTAPAAVITAPAGNVTITAGQSVSFSATASDPNGDPVTVLWHFGDGASSTLLAPGAHTYAAPGTFQASVTATDSHGLADPNPPTRTITVNPVAVNAPPVGVITAPAGNVSITPGGSVSFAATVSDPNGDAVTVLWNFGDGTTSTQLSPGSHTYASAGTFTATLTATDSHGLAASAPPSRTITVQAAPNQPPVGVISAPAGNVTITAGQSVSFAGSASDPNGDAVTVLWTFGDGASSTQLIPGNHVYASAGTYTATFTATDSKGLAATAPPTRTITVQAAPNQPPVGVISAPAGNVTITAGQSVSFAGSASDPDGDAVTVLWTFGDGATSTLLAPGSHTYGSAGSYTVTLTATDAKGLSATTPPTRTITVQAAPNNPPVGVITAPAGNVTITAGQSVSFTGSASDPDGDAVTVLWNFGDGTTSTLLAPGAHTYASAGTFTVTFTATDSKGLAATAPPTRTITVQGVNQPPVGVITAPAGNTTISVGQSVSFAGTASDPNGDAVTVLWNFGDGATSTLLAPGNHAYLTAGTFTVTFTATDSKGLAATAPPTRTITVQAVNQPPVGVITAPAGNVTITAGQSVSFTGTASDPDGDAVTVLWNFGDGATSTLLAPGAHTYATAGTYTVTFTATDSKGLAATAPPTRTITVQAVNLPPVGVISAPAGNVTITAGQSVSFTGTASDPNGDAVTVVWNFGDGTTSTLLAPGAHTYAAAGTYTVTFTATDSKGLAATAPPTRTITVQAVNLPPVGVITAPAANATITAGQSVSFTGTASDPNGDAVTVLWNFGDGTTSTLLAPGAHTYAAAGTYTVTFTATDSKGLAATAPPTRTITVNPAVAAATLTQVQAAVFNSCTGCHSGSSPSAGMNLSAGQTFSNTVNVNATTLSGKRVVPFSSATSALVIQVTTNGHHSPSAANLTLLKSWIDAGALNN